MPGTQAAHVRTNARVTVLIAWRVFIAVWYLAGSVIHLLCALLQPYAYARLDQAPLYPFMGRVWNQFFMPHIVILAILLSAMELAVGLMLLGRKSAVKIALTFSVLFNLFLVVLGLGFSAVPGSWHDFVANRLSNLLFILIQLPLFWVDFDTSIPAAIRARSAAHGNS